MYDKCTTKEIKDAYTTENENLKLNCLFESLDVEGGVLLICKVRILSKLNRPALFTPHSPFQRACAQAAKPVTVHKISELTVKFVL